MNFLVLLGYRLNDDGSITKTMEKRIDLAFEAYMNLNIDYIIVSGGVANPKAGISEASVMREHLIQKGLNQDKILVEDHSFSTYENAVNSLKIMEAYDVKQIIICSTYSHFITYKALEYFKNEINNNKNIRNKNVRLMIYTDPVEDDA